MVGRARCLLEGGDFVIATIEAPGHGDRPRTEVDEREIAAMDEAMAAGRPVGPIVERYNAYLAEQAVPEWRATLDALQGLPEVGDKGPVGYWGINLGTAIGVPLLVAEPRITAAVLGQFWYGSLAAAARRVTVPVEFDVQWDDEHIPRDEALALFDAFASTEKSLHANAGRHKDLPRFEAESAVQFFVRHLRPPAGRSAT
jgi:cephalosporin-C deacetylase-like acetyl esterase